MGKGIVVEILGDVVGPVSECVFYGFTGVHKDRCLVWDDLFKGGDDLHWRGETNVLGD